MANPITKTGFDLIEKELDNLKKNERPKIIASIVDARSHGDLKENAEYHAAREQQGMMEARIRELENFISDVQIIDPSKLNQDKVVFGATVTIEDLDSEKTTTYQLVSELESNFEENKISIKSPLAKAMIGKQVGDEFELNQANTEKNYEILKLEYI